MFRRSVPDSRCELRVANFSHRGVGLDLDGSGPNRSG